MRRSSLSRRRRKTRRSRTERRISNSGSGRKTVQQERDVSER